MIDSHLHPQDPRLAELRQGLSVIDYRRRSGARLWLANGTGPEDWDAVAGLALGDRSILPGFGLHPWKVKGAAPGWASRLESLLRKHPAAFVGEIGLDRWIEPRDENLQERAFRQQMEIAHRLRRPVQIHALRADGWLLSVLDSLPDPAANRMLHSWGGASEMLVQWIQRGFFISVSGYHLDPAHKRHHATLKTIPIDRLLVETDAPDMPPPWIASGSTGSAPPVNPPWSLGRIYREIAEIRGLDVDDLARRVEQNLGTFLAPRVP